MQDPVAATIIVSDEQDVKMDNRKGSVNEVGKWEDQTIARLASPVLRSLLYTIHAID